MKFPPQPQGASGMMVSKTARYALHASMEMALAGEEPVTVATIAARYGLPRTALAKVFQQLVRAGLAVGTRGVGGGYRLSRPPSAISVLDVIASFEPPRGSRRCLVSEAKDGACPQPGCGLRNLFDEADELLRSTFGSVSLSTLIRKRG
ncbi:MAG: Rrf2 family transcriptional regulator [Vicinamibacteria bacterium]|nr:Rrf2 family transcriptional regulator [Vicinamibacteria bacterium]